MLFQSPGASAPLVITGIVVNGSAVPCSNALQALNGATAEVRALKRAAPDLAVTCDGAGIHLGESLVRPWFRVPGVLPSTEGRHRLACAIASVQGLPFPKPGAPAPLPAGVCAGRVLAKVGPTVATVTGFRVEFEGQPYHFTTVGGVL